MIIISVHTDGFKEEIPMATEQASTKLGATIPQLAAAYGVSESLLYRLANEDKLPGGRRLGYRFVCMCSEFEQWLRSGGKA